MEQEDGRTGKGKGKGRGERREVSLGDAVTRKLWAGPEMLRWTLRAGTVATVHWEQGEPAGGVRGEGGETAYLLGGESGKRARRQRAVRAGPAGKRGKGGRNQGFGLPLLLIGSWWWWWWRWQWLVDVVGGWVGLGSCVVHHRIVRGHRHRHRRARSLTFFIFGIEGILLHSTEYMLVVISRQGNFLMLEPRGFYSST